MKTIHYPTTTNDSLSNQLTDSSKDKLLIIDEDTKSRKSLSLALQDFGYAIHETDRAREGLKVLQRTRIDLVLIAILTSDMILSEFTECVQLIAPKVGIIFTSHSTSNWMNNVQSQRLIPVLKSRDLLKLTEEIQKKISLSRRDKRFKNPFRNSPYFIDE
jgi:DNA-binding NtrC family response regulator